MTQTQATLTKDKAINVLETMVGESILGNVEACWKDYWQEMREEFTPEQIAALELITGRPANEISAFDLDFRLDLSVTLKLD